MLSRLFNAVLWTPAGKGITSWLLFVMFGCVFVIFPCGILGQLRYFIVSIPYLCHLSLFQNSQILMPLLSVVQYIDIVDNLTISHCGSASFTPRYSTKLAKPSLSHRSSHQSIVTMFPNH